MTIVLAVVALGAAGCGGSSASSGTSTAGRTSSTASGATSTTARRPAPAHPHKPAAHHTAGSTKTTATSAVATAPPPPPAGTPAPPAGLRAATGYSSYDLCASACSGAVPSSIRRPLHLPTASGGSCPVSGGAGPVTPVGGSKLATNSFIGSSWSAARVQWTATAAYAGPVLIRGRALSGSGAVGFGEGHVPVDELQLLASGMNAPPAPSGGRSWLTFSRVRSPGCYAYQVDGTSFSNVIVFQAT
jgi:hypothetical protein